MKILITAGPTREAIDPVRYISNRSSGKMGYAIAEAALAGGHEVILISGPVYLTQPQGADLIQVESAREMYLAVEERIGSCDAAVFCAAVSDYRVVETARQKIKKQSETMTLELERTEDILGSCRESFGFRGILVGFAAETRDLRKYALEKLQRKGCDFLVANDVSREGIGFDSDENEVVVFTEQDEELPLPRGKKTGIAKSLVEMIEDASAE